MALERSGPVDRVQVGVRRHAVLEHSGDTGCVGGVLCRDHGALAMDAQSAKVRGQELLSVAQSNSDGVVRDHVRRHRCRHCAARLGGPPRRGLLRPALECQRDHLLVRRIPLLSVQILRVAGHGYHGAAEDPAHVPPRLPPRHRCSDGVAVARARGRDRGGAWLGI
eukprot:Amastigsp_a841777_235.p2 type:complete len:166 gc:universal Amastigsp_a841777_235:913-416(-)